MNINKLTDTVRTLFEGNRGLLAMDESNHTCNKRFAAAGIVQNEESRREYREMIITTPGLGEFIGGVILYDETIRQSKRDGTSFVQVITEAGIIPGIKVDLGEEDMAAHPGEKITAGLDGLRERLADYYKMGARFAKWRSVIVLKEGIPSRGCIEANMQTLARYAALCQEAELVPIVEPEVLMEGNHTLARCREATEEVLHTLFNELFHQGVELEGLILKPNMILSGLTCSRQKAVREVAEATVHSLLRVVPAAVPAIAFLSGGQSGKLASERLSAMNLRFKGGLPWTLTFSFARAIQHPALEIWGGKESNVPAAQKALSHRAKCNWAARGGRYSKAMEAEGSENASGGRSPFAATERGTMSSTALYPLRFDPIYQYRPWGGSRLGNLLSTPLPLSDGGHVGEAWLLTDRADHVSVVSHGALKGHNLRELLEKQPEEMLGTLASHFHRFPLLLKFLDVEQQLSVQVHPSDSETKYIPDGETGKTEAWVVLETGKESRIYAGLKPNTTKDILRKALMNGTVEFHLASFIPKVGDGVLIPAGTVHSLSDVVVFEVQENSDVTFRLYDWENIDPKTGMLRPLQVDEGLACVDITQGEIQAAQPVVTELNPVLRERLIQCNHFGLWQYRGELSFTVGAADLPRVLVCIDGIGHLQHGGTNYAIAKGDVVLLPAIVGSCLCQPHGRVNLLEISLPESTMP